MMWVVYILAAWKAINIAVGLGRFVKVAFFTKSSPPPFDIHIGGVG